MAEPPATTSTATGGPVLRTAAAAEYCGLRPQTIHNLIALGEGPKHHKNGRLLAFYAADLDEWLASRLVPA